jgi:predicted molibdopterin-dependent oxidoreductase YjgC
MLGHILTTNSESQIVDRILTVSVNGVAASCADGGRVLDAVKAAGFKVPTLCFDERVGPKGTCRACLVEVDVQGRRQTVAACTWFASNDLKVETHTPALREYRQTLLEMLLSETGSPARCPKCNTTGPCEFHSACDEYDAKWDRFKPLGQRKKAGDPNPFIQRDYDYCIACYRCTSICNDWEQAGAITVYGRGQGSTIASFFNNRLLESPCTFCGQCINTCPTGALTDRKVVGKTDPAKLTRTKTVCPYCGVGCGVHMLSQEGSVVGVEPDFTAPSRGSLCVKGQFASWEFVRSEDRLKHPLIRVDAESKARMSHGTNFWTGSGRSPDAGAKFRRATWDEALDLVAARLKGIITSDGPDAIVCWASARAVNEANYLMQKFARVAIGTNNVDNCSRT